MKQIIILFAILFSTQLSAQCTKCNSLDEALKKPLKVKSLILNPWQHGINLKTLPASIGQLENLEILYLPGHEFDEIPKEIGKLKKLKELSLAETMITSLPDEIYELENLKELILHYTPLVEEGGEAYVEALKKKLPGVKVMAEFD